MKFDLNLGLLDMLARGGIDDTLFYVLYIAFILVSMAAGYLLGSINTSIIVSKIFYRDDIRRHGSGNAGMTNMLRTYGAKAALLTLFGDIFKTVLAIFVAGALLGFCYIGGIATGWGGYLAGLFAVFGHVFPIYYGFKGGKGVLTTATVALVLSPIPFAILMLLFVIIVYFSRYVSLGSVCAVVLYPVVVNGYFQVRFGQGSTPGIIALVTIIIAILVVWCHRGNLARISNRTERKLSFGKKKNEDGTEE